jgi:hypothetical protein
VAAALAPLLVHASARADDDTTPERTFVVGVGGALEVELDGGVVHPGGNVFVEWEAIESWLELELGASLLATPGGTVVPVDLLFKKPFTVAHAVELMVGLGPEVVPSTGRNQGTSFGGEAALDFMFWPSSRAGFWIEPSYDVIAQSGSASQGLGATGGVIVGF